ncbi:unnamed protein product [Leuciscus chuanchicus]
MRAGEQLKEKERKDENQLYVIHGSSGLGRAGAGEVYSLKYCSLPLRKGENCLWTDQVSLPPKVSHSHLENNNLRPSRAITKVALNCLAKTTIHSSSKAVTDLGWYGGLGSFPVYNSEYFHSFILSSRRSTLKALRRIDTSDRIHSNTPRKTEELYSGGHKSGAYGFRSNVLWMRDLETSTRGIKLT